MTAPLHLLTDPARRDVGAWNGWRADHSTVGADLRGADLTGANLTSANMFGTVGASRSDICAAVPVGSGTLCSAIRYPDGAIQIWTGLGTFDSIDEYRERVVKMGGPYEAERLAWLAWVETRLGGGS